MLKTQQFAAAALWYALSQGFPSFVSPFLPLFFSELHFTASQVGILFAIKPFLSAPCGSLAALLADHLQNHRFILLLCYLLTIFFQSIMALFHTFPVELALTLALSTVFTGAAIIADASIMTVSASSSHHVGDYGRVRTFASIAWIVCAPVAGWVNDRFGVQSGFLVYALGSLLAIPAALLLPLNALKSQPPPPPPQQQQHQMPETSEDISTPLLLGQQQERISSSAEEQHMQQLQLQLQQQQQQEPRLLPQMSTSKPSPSLSKKLAQALAIVRYIEAITEAGAVPPPGALYGFSQVPGEYIADHIYQYQHQEQPGEYIADHIYQYQHQEQQQQQHEEGGHLGDEAGEITQIHGDDELDDTMTGGEVYIMQHGLCSGDDELDDEIVHIERMERGGENSMDSNAGDILVRNNRVLHPRISLPTETTHSMHFMDNTSNTNISSTSSQPSSTLSTLHSDTTLPEGSSQLHGHAMLHTVPSATDILEHLQRYTTHPLPKTHPQHQPRHAYAGAKAKSRAIPLVDSQQTSRLSAFHHIVQYFTSGFSHQQTPAQAKQYHMAHSQHSSVASDETTTASPYSPSTSMNQLLPGGYPIHYSSYTIPFLGQSQSQKEEQESKHPHASLPIYIPIQQQQQQQQQQQNLFSPSLSQSTAAAASPSRTLILSPSTSSPSVSSSSSSSISGYTPVARYLASRRDQLTQKTERRQQRADARHVALEEEPPTPPHDFSIFLPPSLFHASHFCDGRENSASIQLHETSNRPGHGDGSDVDISAELMHEALRVEAAHLAGLDPTGSLVVDMLTKKLKRLVAKEARRVAKSAAICRGDVEQQPPGSSLAVTTTTTTAAAARALCHDTPHQPSHHHRSTTASRMQRIFSLVCDPGVLTFFMLATLLGFGHGVIGTFLFMFLHQHGASESLLGWVLLANAVPELPVFYFFGQILKRVGMDTLLMLSTLGLGLRIGAYAMLPQASILLWILPLETLHALTFACGWSVCALKASKIAPPGLESTSQSLFQGLWTGVGVGFGSLLGGMLYHSAGPVAVFQITSMAICTGCLVAACVLGYLHHASHAAIS